MTKEEAQDYIFKNIPITKAMGFKITSLSMDEVIVTAPINNNINHRGSAFGGSIDSLFLTTGWAFIRFLIDHYVPTPIIVGSKGSTKFLKPILDDFESNLIIPDKKYIEQFISTFERFGKARIQLDAEIKKENIRYAEFVGDYVVVKGS